MELCDNCISRKEKQNNKKFQKIYKIRDTINEIEDDNIKYVLMEFFKSFKNIKSFPNMDKRPPHG